MLPFTILFISGCLYKLQQKPSPSTNLKYSVALQPSPSLQSSLFSLNLILSRLALPVSMRACINAYVDVTIFTKRYSVNMTIFSKRYRQNTYVHQGRIEPPQCVVYSPHALALGNKLQDHPYQLGRSVQVHQCTLKKVVRPYGLSFSQPTHVPPLYFEPVRLATPSSIQDGSVISLRDSPCQHASHADG